MSRLAWKRGNIAVFIVVGMLGSCLPKDSRPPPAKILVQVSADDALKKGFLTDDGWRIEFDRFLMTLGRASIDGDPCNAYSEGDYERVLDLQQPSAQKLSLMYGLGTCDFGFSITHPRSDTVIGTGVSGAEALMMQTAGSDIYTAWSGQLTGIVTYVVGTATRGGETKHFTWPFRQDLFLQTCSVTTDAGSQAGLVLRGLDSVIVDLQVRGEGLFQFGPASLAFDPIAAADTNYGNNDGQVTLEELGQVPATVSGNIGGVVFVDGGIVVQPGDLDAGVVFPDLDAGRVDAGQGLTNTHTPLTAPQTLGDFMVYWLLPASVRFQDTGSCSRYISRSRRGG
jgi:hypothetical protein